MKNLTVIPLVAILAACSTTPPIEVTEKQVEVTEKQVEVSSMQSHSFCKGDKLQSYIETKNYYQFTCSDGRYFMLPKYK